MSNLLLCLDLIGTFAFALNGAMAAIRFARLDIVGVVSLGMITAVGGGIIRDVLLPDLPPAAFQDWRYLAVALAGGLIAFAVGHGLHRLNKPIIVLDAFGLSLFAVTGASKALAFDLGFMPAVIVGVVTAVGGGTIRDMMVGQVPGILHSGLYAIPALVGALIVVSADAVGATWAYVPLIGATVCFLIRMLGVKFDLNAPAPYQRRPKSS